MSAPDWPTQAHCWPHSGSLAKLPTSQFSAPRLCHVTTEGGEEGGGGSQSLLTRWGSLVWLGRLWSGPLLGAFVHQSFLGCPAFGAERGAGRSPLDTIQERPHRLHGVARHPGTAHANGDCLCREPLVPGGLKKELLMPDPRAVCGQCRNNKPKHRVEPFQQ